MACQTRDEKVNHIGRDYRLLCRIFFMEWRIVWHIETSCEECNICADNDLTISALKDRSILGRRVSVRFKWEKRSLKESGIPKQC